MAVVEVAAFPTEATPATKTMQQELAPLVQEEAGDNQAEERPIAEENLGGHIQAGHAPLPSDANTNTASEAQIRETTEEKWKYISTALTLFGLSLTFFGLYFTNWHSLTNLLTVLICLFVFFTIFGGLSYIIYQKITEEERLKAERNSNNHQIATVAGCSVQQCLFFLFVFLAVSVYVLVAVNASAKFIGAHKP